MKFSRMIRRTACLAAALLFLISACGAEEVYVLGDTGLALTESVDIHYPELSGPGDSELLKQVNDLIREKCLIGDYLARAARLISDGNLKTEWKGAVLNDVLSCAVSAEGEVKDTRNTHVWTAVTEDLRDGHGITVDELFTDAEAAREQIAVYLEEEVLPEFSGYLLNCELEPLPELFYLEPSGLTLLYPFSQLTTLSDRAGDVRIGWHILRDVLDLSEDGIPVRIGVERMINLSAESAEQLRTTAAEGSLTGIPAKLGESMQELTDRWHMLTDPDGFEGGRLFSLEGGCFRGVFLMTDDLDRKWEKSRVEGIRMDQGCLWGLCVRETQRDDWLSVLGEPDGSVEVSDEKAEANRLYPGTCDYYRCGDYLLQLYSNEEGTLVSVILTE